MRITHKTKAILYPLQEVELIKIISWFCTALPAKSRRVKDLRSLLIEKQHARHGENKWKFNERETYESKIDGKMGQRKIRRERKREPDSLSGRVEVNKDWKMKWEQRMENGNAPRWAKNNAADSAGPIQRRIYVRTVLFNSENRRRWGFPAENLAAFSKTDSASGRRRRSLPGKLHNSPISMDPSRRVLRSYFNEPLFVVDFTIVEF